MVGLQRLLVPRASFEVLSEFIRMLQVIPDDLIDIRQLQTIVFLRDLLGRCPAVEGTNHKIERDASAADAIRTLGISGQWDFVNYGGHV